MTNPFTNIKVSFMKRIKVIIFSLFIVVEFMGCRVGDDDPRISFRSRNKRLIGIWSFKYQIDDSTIVGFTMDIRSNGEVYNKNYKDSFIYFGKWRWISENSELNAKESFTIENFIFLPWQFYITELRYKYFVTYYYPYSIDNGPKYYTTFHRQ